MLWLLLQHTKRENWVKCCSVYISAHAAFISYHTLLNLSQKLGNFFIKRRHVRAGEDM